MKMIASIINHMLIRYLMTKSHNILALDTFFVFTLQKECKKIDLVQLTSRCDQSLDLSKASSLHPECSPLYFMLVTCDQIPQSYGLNVT